MEHAKNEILEAALMLIAEGVSVIPLQPRSKVPALPSWKEYQERIADEATVRGWFDNDRGLNYGIVCGAVSGNLTGLDSDNPAKADPWLVKYGSIIDGCPVVQTGRESFGLHIYMRTTIPVSCGKNELFDIKGEGGYLVGPGSTHPSGKLYKLAMGDMAKIPVIDPELLGLEGPGGNGRGKPEGWQDDILEGDVREGQRNTTLASLVGRWVAKGGSRAEVLVLARGANAGFKPPLPDAEVVEIVDSLFKTHERKHAEDYKEKSPRGVEAFPLTTIADLYAAPPPEFLIENLVHKNTLNLLDSLPGIGKSLFCLELAYAIAQPGDFPFLGAFPVRCRSASRVLIVDQENGAVDLADRMRGIGIGIEAPIYFLHFAGVQLDVEENFARLLATVEQVEPDLIVMDSLIRLHGAKENASEEMAFIMGHLRKLVNLGCTLFAQHHQGWTQERSRGSTDITAAVDFEYSLVRRGEKPNDYLVLSTAKARRAPIESIRLKIVPDFNGRPRMTYIGPDAVETPDITGEILKCVAEKEDGGRTFPEISGWLKEAGLLVGERRLRATIRGMVGSALEERHGKDNRKAYSGLVEACQT
jgi:hypothetical protein